ncbi:MAG: hypothetical protein UHS47_10770 [Oscillospiraceae bacterium]|jgi:hypothetical protein|nr:hypothetical protein [Oscillospiraceae bacterium]
MKNVYCFSIFILILALFLGCTAGNVPVSDRLYTWEHDGFGGDFTITLYADGTFSYYEGMLSSYIGAGTWTEENRIITLKDNTGLVLVNHFRFDDGDLIFMEENSDNFLYVDVRNGDRFHGAPITTE